MVGVGLWKWMWSGNVELFAKAGPGSREIVVGQALDCACQCLSSYLHVSRLGVIEFRKRTTTRMELCEAGTGKQEEGEGREC